jgi:hypothetical protein
VYVFVHLKPYAVNIAFIHRIFHIITAFYAANVPFNRRYIQLGYMPPAELEEIRQNQQAKERYTC